MVNCLETLPKHRKKNIRYRGGRSGEGWKRARLEDRNQLIHSFLNPLKSSVDPYYTIETMLVEVTMWLPVPSPVDSFMVSSTWTSDNISQHLIISC